MLFLFSHPLYLHLYKLRDFFCQLYSFHFRIIITILFSSFLLSSISIFSSISQILLCSASLPFFYSSPFVFISFLINFLFSLCSFEFLFTILSHARYCLRTIGFTVSLFLMSCTTDFIFKANVLYFSCNFNPAIYLSSHLVFLLRNQSFAFSVLYVSAQAMFSVSIAQEMTLILITDLSIYCGNLKQAYLFRTNNSHNDIMWLLSYVMNLYILFCSKNVIIYVL